MAEKKLTKEQYHILKEKGTEAPFTGKLLHNKKNGDYVCAGCGNKIFSSKTKYDSDCGWPSFYDAEKGAMELKLDNSFGIKRIEVTCQKCSGHLGHVFDDRTKPTGKRYCINSLSLKFDEKKVKDVQKDNKKKQKAFLPS